MATYDPTKNQTASAYRTHFNLYTKTIDGWNDQQHAGQLSADELEQRLADLRDALWCSGGPADTMKALRFTIAKYGEYVDAPTGN